VRRRIALVLASAAVAAGCKGGGDRREPDAGSAPPSGAASARDVAADARSAAAAAPEGMKATVLHVTGEPLRIHAEAGSTSLVVGTARAGGHVELSSWVPEFPAADCREGWRQVRPRGYACPGPGTTTEADAAAVGVLAEYRLASAAALPAEYGLVDETPVYLRIPTLDEQQRSEPGLEQRRRRFATPLQADAGGDDFDRSRAVGPVPDDLRGGAFSPLSPKPVMPGSPVAGMLPAGARLSWIAELAATDRTWLITQDLLFVPRDHARTAVIPGFHGLELTDNVGVAFVGSKAIKKYRRRTDDGRFVAEPDPWPPATAIFLTVPAGRYSEDRWLATVEPGIFVRADEAIVAHATPPTQWGLDAGARWLEIDARQNMLLVREGQAITFATLVSVGRAVTARGRFRLTAKHVTMAFAPRVRFSAEVPLVMIATDAGDHEAASLYGAIWQPTWGAPTAAPGIALSPLDARRIFDWTLPTLPDGWHSVIADGTWIVLHD
jgi:hypothetical protein